MTSADSSSSSPADMPRPSTPSSDTADVHLTDTDTVKLSESYSRRPKDSSAKPATLAPYLAPAYTFPTRARNASSISMSEVPDHITLGQILPPEGLCAAHRLAGLEDESESENVSGGDELGSDYDDERPLLPHEKSVFVRESGEGGGVEGGEGGEGIRGVSLDGVEDLNKEERLVALIGEEGVFVTNKNKNAKFGEGGGNGKFNRGVSIDEFGLVVVGEDEEADNGVSITEAETGAEVVSEGESGNEESDDDEGGVPLTPPPSPGAEHEDAPCLLQPKSLVPYKLKDIPEGEVFPEYDDTLALEMMTAPPMFTLPVREPVYEPDYVQVKRETALGFIRWARSELTIIIAQ